MVIPPEGLLLNILFSLFRVVFFHMKWSIFLSKSVKKCVGILMGDFFESVDFSFFRINIFLY